MASTYLTRTTGTPTLGTKCTVSVWVKISEVPSGGGSDRWIFGEYGNGSNHSYLYLRNSSEIGWYEADGSGTVASIITKRLCRDLSGWYHFMIAFDTTLATQADRFKMYINGERITEFSTNTNSITQNYLPRINKASRTYHIGGVNGVQTMFNGLMSHYHHCDGQALEPTVFGSTDADTGEWKINASPTFTPGNNGFTILKDGNTITDQSANSNDFTLAGGTLTKTEDCPSNVFNTMSPLSTAYYDSQYSFAHGNTYVEGNNTNNWKLPIPGTLAANKGKFYWEVKQSPGSHTDYNIFGFAKANGYWNDATSYSNGAQNSIQTAAGNSVVVYGQSGTHANFVKIGGSLTNITDNDIVSFALDLDNRKCWLAKNGVWVDDDSGNANGASINANYPLWNTDDISADTFYTPISVQYYDVQCYYNFGNGYFGNTAVSSAGTNASNNGIFEYDVPAGFTALSTKGLNI